MKMKRLKRRRKKDRKKKYNKIASSNLSEIIRAHNEDKNDPLVLAYNRPDILLVSTEAREEVTQRMNNAIQGANFEDIELIERIVQINEELDLDDTLMQRARGTINRISRTGPTFEARAINVQRLMDDSQNVHDPAVTKELNKTLEGMNPNDYFSLDDPNVMRNESMQKINETIQEMVTRGEITKSRGDDARRIASKMINSNDTCTTYNSRGESEILMTTWNNANSHDERHNIVLGLADSISGPSGSVCINGRIARILGANTTQVSTAELKTAVYNYAGKIMSENGPFSDVEKYINDISSMSDTQKELLREECKAVFDEQDP